MIHTKTIQLKPAQADLIGAGYVSIKNASEVLKTLNRDTNLPNIIKAYVSGWVSDLDIIQDKMDRRLRCNERFEEEVKNTDTLGLMEINRLFLRSSPEQQAAIEEMFRLINAGETIQVTSKEDEHY